MIEASMCAIVEALHRVKHLALSSQRTTIGCRMKFNTLLFALTFAALACSQDVIEEPPVAVSCEEFMTAYYAWSVDCGNPVGELDEIIIECEDLSREASSAGCESELDAVFTCGVSVFPTAACTADSSACGSEFDSFADCLPDVDNGEGTASFGGFGDSGDSGDAFISDSHSHRPTVTITTLELELQSEADDSEQRVRWTDGGGVDQSIMLDSGTAYTLSIQAFDEHEDPVKDVTLDIIERGTTYQLLFVGNAIEAGLVSYTYGDEDDNGLPIGIMGRLEALTAGPGVLTIGVFHIPSDKAEDLAERAASDGLEQFPFFDETTLPVIDFDVAVE